MGNTEEAGQSLHSEKQDCSAAIRAEPRQKAKKASGTRAKLVYLQVKGTKSRSQMMAYNVCLLKGNGLLLHHKQAESKSTAPFLGNSWIMAPGTELGPFPSPEAIHFG